MLEIFLAIFVGIFFGCITGLIPGVHVNLVATIVLGASAFLLKIADPFTIAIFIISMAVTQTFVDAIPAVFLGAPDPDTVLFVLPGHKMLLEGKGYAAVRLTVVGSLIALIISSIIIFPLIPILEFIYPYFQNIIAYLLIFTMILLILRDSKKMWAFIVFVLSGALGLAVFGLNMKNPLLPLLSGLFGLSGLFLGIQNKLDLPPQKISRVKVSSLDTSKALASGIFTASIGSFLPGMGPAQAAIIASQLAGKIGNYAFLILVGSINTVNFVLSLASLYVLGKARNGAIVAVKKIIDNFMFNDIILFVGVVLFVAGIAVFLTLTFSRFIVKIIVKINYKKLCLRVILFVIGLVFLFSGGIGLFVLFVSTMLGFIAPLAGCGRHNMMGCLILPVILYFLL